MGQGAIAAVMNGEDARKWGRDRLICCLVLPLTVVCRRQTFSCVGSLDGTVTLGMIVMVRIILWCSGL